MKIPGIVKFSFFFLVPMAVCRYMEWHGVSLALFAMYPVALLGYLNLGGTVDE